jgi:hypothetical protein
MGDLAGAVQERVAGYKYPRRIWFADELPKPPIGRRHAAHTGNHGDVLPHIFAPA